MVQSIRKSMVLIFMFLLVFTNVPTPVFADMISTQPSNQGSTFSPKDSDFNTIITLDESLSDSIPGENKFRTFTEALTKAKIAEKPVLINVESGTYSAAANASNISNLVIRGTGDDPSDVILTATNGASVIELGNSVANGGFSNFILENLTLKLTYNTSGNPKQSTGIQVGGTGLNQDITFHNIIIDASTDGLSSININGIYLYNGKNITVDNVEYKTVDPDKLRGVVLASTSDSMVKGISGDCTIPVSALDYYDASGSYVADFPSNNYVEGANFLISTTRYGRFSYVMAPTFEKLIEYTTVMNDGITEFRAVVDINKNQLIVDNDLFKFDMMEDYITGTDSVNSTAISRERESSDNWYDTKKVALINPSGNYTVNVEGLTITAYDERYSADSCVPISTAKFSGQPVTMENFDFSGLADPTIEGMIEAGIIPVGSIVESNAEGSDNGNIVWAKMTFDPKGGTVDKSSVILECGIYSGKDPKLPQPIRQGYEFKGWYTEIDGEKNEQIVLGYEGVTVYAQWEETDDRSVQDTSNNGSENNNSNDKGNGNNQPFASDDKYSGSPNTSDTTDSVVYIVILGLSLLSIAAALLFRMKDIKQQI